MLLKFYKRLSFSKDFSIPTGHILILLLRKQFIFSGYLWKRSCSKTLIFEKCILSLQDIALDAYGNLTALVYIKWSISICVGDFSFSLLSKNSLVLTIIFSFLFTFMLQVYCWKGLRFSARQDLEGFSRVCLKL